MILLEVVLSNAMNPIDMLLNIEFLSRISLVLWAILSNVSEVVNHKDKYIIVCRQHSNKFI